MTGDYAAEEGPGDIPSLSAISRDQGGPHQANIVLVDSGPASSLFGITEHKVRGIHIVRTIVGIIKMKADLYLLRILKHRYVSFSALKKAILKQFK